MSNYPSPYLNHSLQPIGVHVGHFKQPVPVWQRLLPIFVALTIGVSGLTLVKSRAISNLAVIEETPIQEVPAAIVQNVPQPKAPKPAVPTGPTAADLQKLLQKWQAEYPAADFGVVVQELAGQKRTATLNEHTSFEAASLYKLYLSAYLYEKIDQGVYNPASYLGLSRTLDSCLQLMITISDNACGETIGYYVGWGSLHNFVRSQGFSETSMVNYNQSTAHDVAEYLTKLQNGQLLSQNHRSSLLNYMKSQVYRSAIPAGVPRISVADKVGMANGYWHDAAIVYHPEGTYVLVVLSKNASASAIKDLSARVSAFFYR